MTTIIRAEAAHDFLALVPSLAGFRPERSLVCVAFTGNRTVGVLRYDLPRRARDRSTLVAAAIGTLCRMTGVDAIVPIVYTDGRFDAGRGLPERALLGMIVKRAEQAGFRVRDALCTAADAWGSIFDPETPATGHPLALIDDSPVTALTPPETEVLGSPAESGVLPSADPAAAEALGAALDDFAGESRGDALIRLGVNSDPIALVESLVARDAAPPTLRLAWFLHLASLPALRDTMMLQFAFGVVVGEAAYDDAMATVERAAELDESVESLVLREAAGGFGGEGGEVGEMLSRLLLGRSSLRPDAGRVERALAVLRPLIANAPASHRLGPLCIAAWLAWSLGRGSAAGAFIDRALELEPEHSMAGLLAAHIGSGALPEWAFSAR